jgi:hypothetical protein
MMIEALLVPVVKRAVDFLFDEGREILRSHLDRGDTAARPADGGHLLPSNVTGVLATTKDDALRRKLDETSVARHRDELEHLLRLQEIQSRNYHLAKEQEAMWGSELVPSLIRNRIVASEKELSDTASRIREVLDDVYR